MTYQEALQQVLKDSSRYLSIKQFRSSPKERIRLLKTQEHLPKEIFKQDSPCGSHIIGKKGKA